MKWAAGPDNSEREGSVPFRGEGRPCFKGDTRKEFPPRHDIIKGKNSSIYFTQKTSITCVMDVMGRVRQSHDEVKTLQKDKSFWLNTSLWGFCCCSMSAQGIKQEIDILWLHIVKDNLFYEVMIATPSLEFENLESRLTLLIYFFIIVCECLTGFLLPSPTWSPN